MKSLRLSQLKGQNLRPFIVKTAGGAASQCLGLMSAIYISERINRPFVIKHFPYSTGGYYPLAIGALLENFENDSTPGRTRGLEITNALEVGKIIEEHPLLKKGFTYEKFLSLVRFLHLETLAKRLRGEWAINYSRKRLDYVPPRIKEISGGYFPFVDSIVNANMEMRFNRGQIPSPYSPINTLGPKPDVVIHYRIGDKRTTYSHPGIHGDGIVDPISFKEILIHNQLLGSSEIYVISDEPSVAQDLLASVGIAVKLNPTQGDLWMDLCLMSRAKLVICPWSMVSQFATTFLVDGHRKVYYPAAASTGHLPKWSIPNLNSYSATFLGPTHPIYDGKYRPAEDAHKIYGAG